MKDHPESLGCGLFCLQLLVHSKLEFKPLSRPEIFISFFYFQCHGNPPTFLAFAKGCASFVIVLLLWTKITFGSKQYLSGLLLLVQP